jgi:adenylate cyclase
MTLAYGYTRAIRERIRAQGLADTLEEEIALPGLPEPHSQLALPMDCGEAGTGVLFVESMEDLRFGWDDEDALATIATQVGMMVRTFQLQAETVEPAEPGPAAAPVAPPSGQPLQVRHFEADGSVFLDNDYLIKGVAGRIVWHLLNMHENEGRREFSNRELRLAGCIGLPEVGDNLEARLHLLTRRLDERAAPLRLARTGRGRFRIEVARPLALVSVPR